MTPPAFTVDGNRLTLLSEGAARLDALLALIAGAQVSLRLVFYIFADDAAGRRVSAALAAAAARGVAVRLIVDAFGSDGGDDELDPLRAAGVEVCVFSPRFGRRYLLRNHQKLALADGECADPRIIVGGFNVEDAYFADGSDDWRDLGLLVEGPAAARLTGYFDALDRWARDPRGRLRALNRTLARWSESGGALRWLIGGPTRGLSPWAKAVRDDFAAARRIDVVAGYFTPSPRLLRRLGRGDGATRVVTAARSDNSVTVAAARFTYRGLLKRGVRIFEYDRAKLHTKLYVADAAVHIGSANFDMRSLFVNLELMLRIDDPAFADHLRRYVDDELAGAREITRAPRSPLARVRNLLAYLLVAVVDPWVSRGLN